jgi:hypothetical protein
LVELRVLPAVIPGVGLEWIRDGTFEMRIGEVAEFPGALSPAAFEVPDEPS